MSNVYNLEPPTKGKVILKTTHGDLEIELWAKEVRNTALRSGHEGHNTKCHDLIDT